MRFLIYKVKGKGNEKRRSTFGVNIERVLFLSFIAVFVLLIAVQAALLNPSVRTFLTSDSEYEGAPLALEEYLFEEGELGLSLVNAESSPKLKVLVNGDEVANFSIKKIDIKVRNGDVVEIDGSQLKNPAEVEIFSKSDNVITDCLNKKIKVRSNITNLIKVNVE